MANPIRNTDPEKFHTISIRTHQAQLLMVPSDYLNSVIAGIIGKYQEEFGIEIYAYCVLSNHYHMLVRAPYENLWRFAEGVNREISRRINRLRDRKGYFWGKRYSDLIIAEVSDCLEALLYIITNPCNHGLVEDPKHWPGLNCYSQILHERLIEGIFTNYTEYGKAKRKAEKKGKTVNIRDFQSIHHITLSPLPQFAHLSQDKRAEKLKSLIERRVKDIKKKRLKMGKGFLGRKKVLHQDPKSFPQSVKESPRPSCYSKNPVAIKEFMSWYVPWVKAYKKASAKFRAGLYDIEFPPHSIKPPSHYNFAFAPT